MSYPASLKYVNAIRNSRKMLRTLNHLEPVCDDRGELIYSSGNFAIVFKMRDVNSGEFYALKCFTRSVDERKERYSDIHQYLKTIQCPYIIDCNFIDNEIRVDGNGWELIQMKWIEGKLLGKLVQELCDAKDQTGLDALYQQFKIMALNISQLEFAHGDIKHDNVLVSESFGYQYTLKLIDYDGMYVPAFEGREAQELGGRSYQHPLRDSTYFNKDLDSFSVYLILLSLAVLRERPEWHSRFNNSENLLLNQADLANFGESVLVSRIKLDLKYDNDITNWLDRIDCMYSRGIVCDVNFKTALTRTPKTVLDFEKVIAKIPKIHIVYKQGYYGYCNSSGELLTKYKYDEAFEFQEGKGRVKLNGKWGFVNLIGKETIELKLDQAQDFENHVAFIKVKDKSGFINDRGNIFLYDKIGQRFSKDILEVRNKDKWGFVNKRGYEVIPLQYDAVEEIFNDLVVAEFNGEWGVIDLSGNIVVPFKYESVRTFSEGLAVATLFGKYGYINKFGQEVIPFIYEDAKDFINGVAIIKILGLYGMIDPKNDIIAKPRYDSIGKFSEGFAVVGRKLNLKHENLSRYGYINLSGKEIIPLIYTTAKEFHEGVAIVFDAKDHLCGVIDSQGKIVIKCMYGFIESFEDGIAIAGYNSKNYDYDSNIGLITKDGSIVADIKYAEIARLDYGFELKYREDRRTGFQTSYINFKGKQLFPPDHFGYGSIRELDEHLLALEYSDFWGIIDIKGNVVLPLIYDSLETTFDNKIEVSKDGQYWLLDKQRQLQSCDSKYVDLKNQKDSVGIFCEGIAIVSKWIKYEYDYNYKYPHDFYKYGYTYKYGEIFVPETFDKVENFSKGLGRVKRNEKWGFVNKIGNEILPVEYDDIGPFYDGIAVIKVNDLFGFINDKGNIEIQPQFHDLIPVKRGGFTQPGRCKYSYGDLGNEYFKNGLVIVGINERYGVINIRGEIIIPIQYSKIYHVKDDLFTLEENTGSKIVDSSGREILISQEQDIRDIDNSLSLVCVNDKYGYINSGGKIIIKAKYDKADNFIGDFANVTSNKRKGTVDISGNESISLKFDQVFDDPGEEFMRVGIDKKYGFISRSGVVIVPLIYDAVRKYREDLAAVVFERKWGFIDKEGRVIIPFIYDKVTSFINGISIIIKNRQYIYKDEDGNIIEEELIRKKMWKEKFYVQKKEGKFGCIDLNGNEIILPEYDNIEQLRKEEFELKNSDTDRYFLLSVIGK